MADFRDVTKGIGHIASQMDKIGASLDASSLKSYVTPSLNIPLPDFSTLRPRNYEHADYQYEVVMDRIKDFESELNPDEEVMLQFAQFGTAIVMAVEEIGYSNPSLVHFYGTVNGDRAELIQNVHQMSFLMVACKVPKGADAPARRIGFLHAESVGDEE